MQLFYWDAIAVAGGGAIAVAGGGAIAVPSSTLNPDDTTKIRIVRSEHFGTAASPRAVSQVLSFSATVPTTMTSKLHK